MYDYSVSGLVLNSNRRKMVGNSVDVLSISSLVSDEYFVSEEDRSLYLANLPYNTFYLVPVLHYRAPI